MSLNWNWNDKMGEVTDVRGNTCNIYRGNAFMIAVYEWEENGSNLYGLSWFFADEKHMKNCLGLTKEYKDSSVHDYEWSKFKLSTAYPETAKFVSALAKAKASLTIELY